MVRRIQFSSKEAWLKKRTRIGGSDVSAILGLNPWKTNVELWEEKTGRKKPEDITYKPFVQYGISAEPLLRDLFAIDYPQYKVEYFGDNMVLNDKYPFGASSLDGELTEISSGRKGILEIKTTEIMNSTMADKWKGRIPDYYYTQVLWYLLITEYDFAYLKAQLKYDIQGEEKYMITKHYKIESEEVKEDMAYILEKVKDFNGYIERNERPPLILPSI